MKEYNPQDILNIAVVGHGGEGKTTLTEAMLFDSGATERMGRVEDGNTVTDYDSEETKRHISIGMGLAPVEWKDKKINLIDVPGYFDFEGEAIAAYGLADSAMIVLGPNGIVPVGAQKAYDYCVKHNIPRMFVVNQIDKENTDLTKTVGALGTKYGAAVTAVQLPIMNNGVFEGVVDLIEMKAYLFDGKSVKDADIPAGLADEATALRETLVENAAGNDETLMEKFFDGQELSKEDILAGLKAGVLQGTVAPVFVTAAASDLGAGVLMDGLLKLMPMAADIAPIHA
ncbi:MAG: GTP-binding protein, partial [Christensenella sp.]|uniref:GTP-binding protein n=1 Tax=Christensenella sp. TaxID=1935934 RepID=UPI002B1FB253